jgi:lipoprotein-anchoring transpeptidase ErfK/SrfK
MGYSSYVNFWMSFVGNVGIHDSSWRGTSDDGYGGDIYLTNGSHGCINTPYDAAKKIYETINVGTAIVVY